MLLRACRPSTWPVRAADPTRAAGAGCTQPTCWRFAGSVSSRAPTALLLGYHLAGMVLLSALWGLLGALSRPGQFAAGLLAQLTDEARAGLRRIWCGS